MTAFFVLVILNLSSMLDTELGYNYSGRKAPSLKMQMVCSFLSSTSKFSNFANFANFSQYGVNADWFAAS